MLQIELDTLYQVENNNNNLQTSVYSIDFLLRYECQVVSRNVPG